MRPYRLLPALLGLLLFSCRPKEKADLLIYNARVYTVDSAFSVVSAIAVRDGKVLATGTDADIEGKYEGGEVLDAGGKAVYPGFIDAHSHFVGYSQSLYMAALFGSA
jgi:predicted amidohydrolase YtcJ